MEIKNARATERHIELEQTQARSVIPDIHDTHQLAAKPAPKKHKARVLILRSGTTGITENEILRYCRLSSGRNYLTELERCLDIQFERIDEPNPDGIGSHYRYRFIKRSDVQKVIALVNSSAVSNGQPARGKPLQWFAAGGSHSGSQGFSIFYVRTCRSAKGQKCPLGDNPGSE